MRFMTMREKQILPKKLGVTTLKELEFKTVVKYKAMYGVKFFYIEALLSLKNAWLPAIFFLDTKSTS